MMKDGSFISCGAAATNNIVICGGKIRRLTDATWINKPSPGQDGAAPPFHTYASADKKLGDMAALLNTQTWEWTLAHPSADQPLPQAMAAAAIVNGSNLIYGLGMVRQMENVCRISYMYRCDISNGTRRSEHPGQHLHDLDAQRDGWCLDGK